MTEPQENAAKIARIYEAFERGEPTQALLEESFDPDVEINAIVTKEAGGRTYRGYEGMAAFFGELRGELREIRYEPPQFHPLGDTVIVFTQVAGTERDSGLPFSQELSLTYEFNENGRVRRVTAYDSPAEALEAAQKGHADA